MARVAPGPGRGRRRSRRRGAPRKHAAATAVEALPGAQPWSWSWNSARLAARAAGARARPRGASTRCQPRPAVRRRPRRCATKLGRRSGSNSAPEPRGSRSVPGWTRAGSRVLAPPDQSSRVPAMTVASSSSRPTPAAISGRTHRPPPKPVTVVRPTSTAACRCRRFPTGWRPRARPVAFAGRGESGRRRTASCRSRRAPISGCSRLESAMPSKHGPLAGAARGLVGGGPGWLVDEIEAHRRGWGDQGRPAVRSLTRAPTGIPRRAPGTARGCRPERSVPPPPYSEPEPFVGKHGGKEHPALRLQFIGRRNQLHLGLVKQRRHYQRQLSLREPAAGAVVNPDAERRKHSRLLVLLTPWKVAVYVEPLGMGKVLRQVMRDEELPWVAPHGESAAYQRQAAGQRQTGGGARARRAPSDVRSPRASRPPARPDPGG